ncbi:MAG: DUF4230 domain-containing protein [Phycisphaeraceae bacterium]
MELVIGIVIGVAVALALALFIVARRSKKTMAVQTHSSLIEMRSVGELVVFKVVTKEIVTASQHWLGEFGKNFLSWFISGKKMAMIFEFGIDFKYDLRSKDFVIEESPDGKVTLKMPRCDYQTYIRDISFYDEQNAKLLPGLLPDVVGKLLGGGFSEEDKNKLKEAARAQADVLAGTMIDRMQSEVQLSAEQTLEALARGFGAKQINVDFSNSRLVQASKVDTKVIDQMETKEKLPGKKG